MHLNGHKQIFLFILTNFYGLHVSLTYCFYNKDVCEDVEDIRNKFLSIFIQNITNFKHLINKTLY